MKKKTLLEKLTSNYARFANVLAQVSEKMMMEPFDGDTKSGKVTVLSLE